MTQWCYSYHTAVTVPGVIWIVYPRPPRCLLLEEIVMIVFLPLIKINESKGSFSSPATVTLGARDLSCAVSGFKSLWPAADPDARNKPLVPRVATVWKRIVYSRWAEECLIFQYELIKKKKNVLSSSHLFLVKLLHLTGAKSSSE